MYGFYLNYQKNYKGTMLEKAFAFKAIRAFRTEDEIIKILNYGWRYISLDNLKKFMGDKR